MIRSAGEGLVSPSDIAEIAGVSRAAVSNWRKRANDFPPSVAGSAAKPLFSREAVTEWLERRGHAPRQDAGETNVWAALNAVRGELSADEAAELVLALAVQRKTGKPDGDLSAFNRETVARVRAAIDRVDVSSLASAADFVLERLSRSQGRVGADFGFVGSRTTTLLANLAAARPGAVLYDPACGIAAALLKAVAVGARPSRVVGHDIDAYAIRVAAQRATLHGVGVELSLTDVLSEDLDPGLLADVIVLEPPFGLRFDGPLRLTDARFDYGTPPRSSADTAWIQHSVAHLTEQGRAYVLSPSGTLFRSGEEAKIRAELVRRGSVEAVIGLPGKLLPHTSIPLALWVLRRPLVDVAAERVLFIDASESVAPENSVAAWLNDPAARKDIPHTAITIADVLAAEAVLSPQRWVDRTERDPEEVARTYTAGWVEISDTMRKLQNTLSSFEQLATFSKARVMTVAELIEQGVLDLRMGKPKDRYDDVPGELRDRIVTAADVRDGRLHETGLEDRYPAYPELTSEGDVLVTTMNSVRARVDESGGHLPTTGVHRLRVRDHNVLSPSYLALALTGSWNERFQGGSTIQRASIRDLEVPLLPISEQRDIRLSAISLTFLRQEAARLVDQTSKVGTALLDAVRYNVPLPTSTSAAGKATQPVRQEDAEDAR